MNFKIREQLEKYYDENIWEHITLGEALERWSEKYKNKIAVIDEDIELTYKKLNEEVDYYAEGLLNNGINKGDKVLLQLPNCAEFIIISFALFKVGAIPIMGLPAHRKREIKGILEKSEAKAYIAKDKYLGFSYIDMIREIQNEIDKKINVFILGEKEEYKSFHNLRWGNRISDSKKNKASYKDIGLLLLSGGTTGIPKLIPRRHTDYLYVAKECGKICKMNKDTVYLVSLPIAHNFPLGCPGVIGTLIYGGRVVICPTTSPDEIIPLIEDEEVTITGLVPAMANMCMEFLKIEEYDLSSLKVLQVGGSVLDSITAERIKNVFNCKLQQIFGIAEGLICCTDLEDDIDIIYKTQGKPISKYDEIKIIDDNGEEVPDGEYGELIVRGPYTIYGYYNLKEVNVNCVTEDCYFKTGDKAKKLKNGNYQIVGRLKEMINRAGEKIIPSEIEEVLLKHKDIIEVQVVGVPDEILGEKIGVFIIKRNEEINLDEIRDYLKKNGLAHFKMPDIVKYVESWPLTSVGKIDKSRLIELVL